MRVYIDTSAILRLLLHQEPRYSAWGDWDEGFTSRLAEVETARAIDRLRLDGAYTDTDVAAAMVEARALLAELSVVELDPRILALAGRPMPTVVGTLDAIHLTTALELRTPDVPDLVFVTHDRRQRLGAQGLGLAVSDGPE